MAFPEPAANRRIFHCGRKLAVRRHLLCFLLFWPAVFIRYLLIEKLNPAAVFWPIHCPLDDAIPFCEAFLIPYVLWYFYIAGFQLYTLLYDLSAFRKYTKFLAFSFAISTCIFLLFPSCQNLRPQIFPRDNVLVLGVQLIYRSDTNTNVFPSEHAIGALAVLIAALHTTHLRRPWIIALIGITSLFICLSTVFLKQHSVLDVAAALPICAIVCRICYSKDTHTEPE